VEQGIDVQTERERWGPASASRERKGSCKSASASA
jgi:hypothetical protein